MQIKINSSQRLGHNSINHVESLLAMFKWNVLPNSVVVNIDCTLKDVDDKLYVQLIIFFGDDKKSFIADAATITEALKFAMSTLNGKLISTPLSIRKGRGKVFKAA
jgi:hypothetical protein